MSKVRVVNFEPTSKGENTHFYTIENNSGASVTLCDLGASVVSIKVPDKNGSIRDVVLGYEHIDGYEFDGTYFGATVGRCCGRIAYGKFTLNGEDYQLPVNNGSNHLHGGFNSFSRKVWLAVVDDKVPNTEKQGAFAKTRNNSANSVHMPKLESGNMPYYARWIGSIILFILGIMALSGGAVPIAAIWIVIGLNLCPKTYPIARKFERWLIAIIIWLFGASSLFSGLILVAAALILVGMNICPATSEKTMEKERKIWSKINNSLKK